MASGPLDMSSDYGLSAQYPYFWSLEQYKNVLKKNEQTEKWDELEKSVIASRLFSYRFS